MKQSQFYYLLRRGLFKGASIVKEGLVMFNKFTTAGISHPAQGSAAFDGASDYIQIKDDGKGSAFDTQEFTIGAWVYVNGADDEVVWSYDFTSNTAPFYAQHMRVTSSLGVFCGFNNNGSYVGFSTGANVITPNTWHYIAYTFKNNARYIYVDGSVQASQTNTYTIQYYNQEVYIGYGNYGGSHLNGNLSNVAFWNRALSSDEINSVMFKSYDALEASEKSGLQAWYRLDDISGTSVPDSSGNGNNGTAY